MIDSLKDFARKVGRGRHTGSQKRLARTRRRIFLEPLENRVLLAAVAYESPVHVFSIDDVIGGFDGSTYAEDSTIINLDAEFEDPANPDPPDYDGDVRKITDGDGNVLYPVDNEFTFAVTDFVGAVPGVRDGKYEEGYAGNIMAEGEVVGLTLSNTATEIFKSGASLGTWLSGLGGNTVKASTEHYVVMQDVLSDQAFPGDPDAVYQLDNDLRIVGGDRDGQLVADVIDELQVIYDGGDLSVDIFPVDEPDGLIDIRDVLLPNETTILENIAVSDDYSVTLKDDGKLLYRWGTSVKRPTDLRVRAELAVPDEWKTFDATEMNGGKGFRITSAQLILNHAVTNNPNDQIRPEDLENEAATGRKPSYVVIQHPEHPGDPDYALWVSPVNDFSGDGTFYPSYFKLDDNGDIVTVPEGDETVALAPDGTEVGVINTNTTGDAIGTVFREVQPNPFESDVLLSSDLLGGYTNAWYTTMDRDPFEAVLDGNGDYVVGPRWRMQSNKFGQDLPSVEIPLIPHSEPPFTKDNIKYEVGTDTTTVINLLDWVSGEDSPLAYSNGWTMPIPGAAVVDGVTAEGLRLSDNFDIAFYTKGDIKPARIYNVQLVMAWETETVDFDYGDAPHPGYPTLKASDGAAHALVPGFHLGLDIDSEYDGQPNADASGDDTLDGNDDEDGVTFVDPLARGEVSAVDVVMSQTAKLNAWIDFNADGDWDDAGEQVFTDTDLVAGVNHLQINVPADATITDQTFARFRANSTGGLTPRGFAADGEVEDYALEILNAPLTIDVSYLNDTTFDGSESFATTARGQVFGDDFLAIDPSQAYVLSGQGRSGDDLGGQYVPSNRQYFGFASYDTDMQLIAPWNVLKYQGATDTTLAAALEPGDTKIVLTDATGWANAGAAYERTLAWYGYTNSDGFTYPDYTYTRNVARDFTNGVWAAGGIDENVITLSEPWAGPAIPSGTAMRNATSGATYNYAALNGGAVPNTWTPYSATVTDTGTLANQFRPGTAYIKPLILTNYQATPGNLIQWQDVSVQQTSGKYPSGETVNLLADASIPVDDATYSWTQVSGPTVQISQPNQVNTEVVLPVTGEDTQVVLQVERTVDGTTTDLQITIDVLAEPITAAAYLDATTFASSESFATTAREQVFGDDFLSVDPSQTYVLSGQGRSGDDLGGQYVPSNRQYFGFASYDTDMQLIAPWNVLKYQGATDTTLAAALEPGDTKIVLTDATGWANAGAAYERTLAWYGYTNSDGFTYPDYTYTRNVARDFTNGVWATGGIVGNEITLPEPWAGPAIPSGTAVRNATSGATYNYAALNGGAVPNSWTPYSATVTGTGTLANQFRPGTAYIKPLILTNYQATPGNLMQWRDVTVQVTSGKYASGQTIDLEADAANSFADATYAWTQISGTPGTFTNADKSNAQFELPDVTSDEELVLHLSRTLGDTTLSVNLTVSVLGTGVGG